MSDPRPLRLLHDLFGGSFRQCRQLPNRRIIWIWETTRRSSEKFLKHIRRFTIVKTAQINVALRYLELTAHKSGKARSLENRKGQEQCYLLLKELKKQQQT